MSTVFFNLISVSGPKHEVRRFRNDARRRLSPSVRKAGGVQQVDFSLEHLFAKHRLAAPSSDGIPQDAGHYFTTALPMTKWHTFARVLYEFEVKNNQMYVFLIPLSRCYAELCFVDSELCLDDGSVSSFYVSRGRVSTWDLPEDRQNSHWERAAKSHGFAELDDACIADDNVRSDAETAMLTEGLTNWDDRVLRTLRKHRGS